MTQEVHIILDAHGLLLHCYHHSGVDADGSSDENGRNLHTPGYALHNFVHRYLVPITQQFAPRQIVAVWEAGNEYRESLYPEYKSNRGQKVSQELRDAQDQSIAVARRFFDALGITQVEAKGVEAGDVIAYLATKLRGGKIVHTVDADLIQLVSDTCSVWMRGEPVDGYRVEEGFLVAPQSVALFKALCGDASDGYTGVPGFGKKEFHSLLETYGQDGLDQIDNAFRTGQFDEIDQALEAEPGKHPLLERVKAGLADAKRCHTLATLWPILAEQGPNGFNRVNWRKRLPSRDAMCSLLDEVGCPDLTEQLDRFLPNRWILDATSWNEQEDLAEAGRLFAHSPCVAIDLETWSPEHAPFLKAARGDSFVDVLSSRITGMGMTFGRNLEYTMYVTVDHAGSANLPKEVVLQLLEQVPDGVPVVVHNASFERTVILNELGADLTDLRDTQLLAAHIEETESKNLKDLSKRWFNYDQTRYKDVVPEGKTMRDLSATEVFSYGADDPFVTAHLYDLFTLITACEGTLEFCEQHEFPSIYPISDAYLAGVEIDWIELDRQGKEDAQIYEQAMAKLRSLLETNQTSESIAAGAKILFEEEETILRARAHKEGWAEEIVDIDGQQFRKLDVELYKAAVAAQDSARYTPYVRVEKDLMFKPAPAQLSQVAAALGLPPVEKVTAKGLTAYVLGGFSRGALLSVEVEQFLSLVVFARGEDEAEVGQLNEFCANVLRRSLPEDKVWEKQGDELNLDSHKQMFDLLYGKMALPMRVRKFEVSKTRKDLGLEDGSAQANDDALRMAIVMDTPEGDWRRDALLALIEARKANTRVKMFYRKYPLWKHPLTGLVHPYIQSAGTETRRPSSSNPNALQWPKEGEGVKFRRCILPNSRFGHDLIVSLDWDQEELRFAAGLSLDPELSACYIGADVAHLLPPWTREFFTQEQVDKWLQSKTRDVHSLTGSGLAKIKYDEFIQIVKDEAHPDHKRLVGIRKDAKAVNFGSTYGIGPPKLARRMLCSVQTATDYLNAKKKLYFKFEEWKQKVIDSARKLGYVTTLLGTRRHVYEDINSSDADKRSSVERQLVNFLIQGLAADILKRVLSEIHARQTLHRHGAVLIAPIYDELVFSVHSSNTIGLIREVQAFMTQPVPGLPVPIISSVSLGATFGDQIEMGTSPSDEVIWAAISKALATKEAA